MSVGYLMGLKARIGVGTANRPGGTSGAVAVTGAPLAVLSGQRIGGERTP